MNNELSCLPPSSVGPRLAALTAVIVCSLWLNACGSAAKGENGTPAVLNQLLIGKPAGEFFDRYGGPSLRTTGASNTAIYEWQSAVGFARPGPNGLDDRICRLTVTVDKALRISAVEIEEDGLGVRSTSRCREIFDAKNPAPLLEPPRRVRPQ